LLLLRKYVVERKAWFDKFGEYGLKEGIPSADGSNILKIINTYHSYHWRL
jgi:hypothetical protein